MSRDGDNFGSCHLYVAYTPGGRRFSGDVDLALSRLLRRHAGSYYDFRIRLPMTSEGHRVVGVSDVCRPSDHAVAGVAASVPSRAVTIEAYTSWLLVRDK